MIKIAIFVLAFCVVLALSQDSHKDAYYSHDKHLQPCSSQYFHDGGKCGRHERGYLRCEKGKFCSKNGFCGNGPEFEVGAICPCETRENPNPLVHKKSPDDMSWFQRLFSNCFEWMKKDKKQDDCHDAKCS